tara:strand:+ start:345 stop:956 length:612 start_codon:yes stop_codon:yes gene_type:complete
VLDKTVQLATKYKSYLVAAVLGISIVFVTPLILINQYYSEKNLFMMNIPFAISESDGCSSMKIDYVLPKGVYKCFLLVGTNNPGPIDLEANELLVRCSFYASGYKVDEEETTIPFSSSLVERYQQEHEDNRRMFLDTGERVLPHPWAYMENEVDGNMKFAIGWLYLDSDGSLGQIGVNLCGLGGIEANSLSYSFRIEKFIDAV